LKKNKVTLHALDATTRILLYEFGIATLDFTPSAAAEVDVSNIEYPQFNGHRPIARRATSEMYTFSQINENLITVKFTSDLMNCTILVQQDKSGTGLIASLTISTNMVLTLSRLQVRCSLVTQKTSAS